VRKILTAPLVATVVAASGCNNAPVRRDLADASDAVFTYCEAPISGAGGRESSPRARRANRRAQRELTKLLEQFEDSPDAEYRTDWDVTSTYTARGVLQDLKTYAHARCERIERRLARLKL
jgi:capsid protein